MASAMHLLLLVTVNDKLRPPQFLPTLPKKELKVKFREILSLKNKTAPSKTALPMLTASQTVLAAGKVSLFNCFYSFNYSTSIVSVHYSNYNKRFRDLCDLKNKRIYS